MGGNDDLLNEFIAEAREHIEAAESCLLALARDPRDLDAVQACFRALHTIKGTAGFFGQDRIQGLAHAAEQLLDEIRSGRLACGAEQSDALLQAVSRLAELLDAAEKNSPPPTDDAALIARLKDTVQVRAEYPPTAIEAAGAASPSRAVPVPVAEPAFSGVRSAPAATPGFDGLLARLMAAALDDQSELSAVVGECAALAIVHGWSQPAIDLVAAARAAVGAGDAYGKILGGLSRLLEIATDVPVQAPLIPDETLADFIAESGDLLAEAEDILIRGDPDFEKLGALFRAFHTIKGMCAYLGLGRIESLTHKIESELAPVRDGELPFTPRLRQVALAGVDAVRELTDQVRDRKRDAGPWPRQAAELARTLGLKVDEIESSPADEARELTRQLEKQGVPQAEIARADAARKPGETVAEHLARTGRISSTQAADAAAKAKELALKASEPAKDVGKAEGFARVSISRLDELVNLVGELIISQSMIAHDPQLAVNQHLHEAVGRQNRIVRELQDLSLSLRMVQLRAAFQKVSRVVHDTARKLGKQVDLRLVGEDTEIDRTLAESLGDPLMHMVRNALDHGIETPEARLAAGKDATGVVTLSAHQTSDSVIIRLSDDGLGMDPRKLIAKAREKGLLRPDQQVSDAEAYQLIFAAGFSTAEQVTAVSGRGVGMDVVQKNVERMNGLIDIESAVGRGSVFTIRLPLTTAILDAMLLRVGTQRFLIPVTAVLEAVRPSVGDVHAIMGKGRVIRSRGQLLPLARLSDLFAVGDVDADQSQAVVLVVEQLGGGYGLQIDEILGQQQVVIKPLDRQFGHHLGLAGTAILGDGRVGMILDPVNLLKGIAA